MYARATRSLIRPASAALMAPTLGATNGARFVGPTAALAARSVTTLSKALYTAKGEATGQGRNGKAYLTEEGPFEVQLAMPKSLGGSGQGNNPEQLFASKEKIPLPANVKCAAHVSIGPPSSGPNPFGLAVDLIITSDANGGEEQQNLEKATQKAHEICPYSNATRNNVPVNIKVE